MALAITSSNLDEVLNSGKPVVIDFWAEWCGPCRMFSPIVDEVAEEYSDKVQVCKLNVDEAQDIASRYGVQSIPTLILFKEGEAVSQIVGAQSKEAVEEFIGVK